MLTTAQLDHFRDFGWLRVPGAVPRELCARLVEVLERELNVPRDDPSQWDRYGPAMADLLPLWGHQTQWDIRQHPNLHAIWSALWGSPNLCVSLDSCRFTPPWRQGHAEPHAIHWDHDPHDRAKRMIQGVIALTDTAANQGGYRCVSSLLHDRAAWPAEATIDTDGDSCWFADTTGREIVHVPAETGDLILWDSLLAHSNSKNLSTVPRMAFYVMMGPPSPEYCAALVESWRTGICLPWWRDRPGYNRIEPWAPAKLTELGEKLLGLQTW